MIELVIAACLASGECRSVPLLYDAGEVSLMTCMVSGQAEAARWQARNPAWTVTGWRCGVFDERSKEA
jgi:hypothetical protein